MKKVALLLLAVASAVPGIALAHHSYAMFDMNKTLALDATIMRFKWQNPHSFIDAEIKVPGGTERWTVEMTSPNNLAQAGWKRSSLRPGDHVKLYVHPLRAGAKGGSYVGVRFADGATLGQAG
ncbi:MAG: DUF6152 family protein [Croceibacterium sp.]